MIIFYHKKKKKSKIFSKLTLKRMKQEKIDNFYALFNKKLEEKNLFKKLHIGTKNIKKTNYRTDSKI